MPSLKDCKQGMAMILTKVLTFCPVFKEFNLSLIDKDSLHLESMKRFEGEKIKVKKWKNGVF